jgi:hypothetical protein
MFSVMVLSRGKWRVYRKFHTLAECIECTSHCIEPTRIIDAKGVGVA